MKRFRRSKPSSYGNKKTPFSRVFLLIAFVGFIFSIIIFRLFQLQILDYEQYSKTAKGQHFGAIELPARRGDILVRDTHSGELSKLATNTTLDLIYVDPLVAENKEDIAKKLSSLLFMPDEYELCLEKPKECKYSVIEDASLEQFETTQPVWDLGFGDEIDKPVGEPEFKEYNQLVDEVAANIFRKISQTEVDFVILKRDADKDLMSSVVNEHLPGIFVDTKRLMVYGDPTLISPVQLPEISAKLSDLLKEPTSDFEKKLSRRKVRYVFLKNKLKPEISRQIKELKLKGVVLIPEHWRYYPEGSLAANIIGFLNRDGTGQYGIEGYFNTELEGKKGKIYAESDPFGRQITVGDSKIVNAVNGDKIILTIDRIVQKKVEEILSEAVDRFRADSGQVIVMNPFTGAIVAMANYPSFNPNYYTDVYKVEELDVDPDDYTTKPYKTMTVFKENEKGQYVPITDPEEMEDEDLEKYIYKNKFGHAVYKNKAVSEYYEPGSVFKPIVMSIAIDSKEVEPQTTFDDDGPLEIDEFTIKNSDHQYHGKTTMTETLELSLNTGMSFVAKLLGKRLMHKYIKDFGFGEYTNIQLEGETKGRVDFYKRWSKAQMLTTSFGQGIVVTPLQMVAAWASLANGGKLVQPYVVESMVKESETIDTKPNVINRVLTEEASSIITSMLVSVVRRGHGRPADIPGHLIAGKTGTSQVAGKGGKYETGEGSLITSFAGYFPALEPQFVMLVKFDRPRIGENTWGSTTGAPTFRKIAEFLIDYYNIQPTL